VFTPRNGAVIRGYRSRRDLALRSVTVGNGECPRERMDMPPHKTNWRNSDTLHPPFGWQSGFWQLLRDEAHPNTAKLYSSGTGDATFRLTRNGADFNCGASRTGFQIVGNRSSAPSQNRSERPMFRRRYCNFIDRAVHKVLEWFARWGCRQGSERERWGGGDFNHHLITSRQTPEWSATRQ
jgi:hypothetical protein